MYSPPSTTSDLPAGPGGRTPGTPEMYQSRLVPRGSFEKSQPVRKVTRKEQGITHIQETLRGLPSASTPKWKYGNESPNANTQPTVIPTTVLTIASEARQLGRKKAMKNKPPRPPTINVLIFCIKSVRLPRVASGIPATMRQMTIARVPEARVVRRANRNSVLGLGVAADSRQ